MLFASYFKNNLALSHNSISNPNYFKQCILLMCNIKTHIYRLQVQNCLNEKIATSVYSLQYIVVLVQFKLDYQYCSMHYCCTYHAPLSKSNQPVTMRRWNWNSNSKWGAVIVHKVFSGIARLWGAPVQQ